MRIRSGLPVATIVSVASVLLASACSSKEIDATTTEALSSRAAAEELFGPHIKRVVVEVDYAPGAEPFVSPTAAFDEPWSVFRENANALFGGAKEVVIPSRLEDMERLDDIEGDTFGEQELMAIASKHRDTKSSGDTVAFYFVFVDGLYRDENGYARAQTPGVSIRNRGVVGVFKPAVAHGFRNPDLPTYMEQSTLIHEFGHAVGLVDRGIEPMSGHHDEDRGAHCGNPACIMYWKNVFVKDGVDFVDTYLRPRRGVLFGPECLADVRAIERSALQARAAR